MINRLKKNISLLLIVLMGAIFLSSLAAFTWKNYEDALDDLKADVRAEIRDIGWLKFLTGKEEIKDLQYCIFSRKENDDLEIIVNHFTDKTDEQLLDYGHRIVEGEKTKRKFPEFTYIFKWNKKLGRQVILISGETAFQAALPEMIASLLIGIAGIVVLIFAARALSRWLVRPVENMIAAEKKFMSNASHELKTPLTVIGTNVELLQGEVGENKHLQYIRQETERMTLLVSKMLTLVRLDSPIQKEEHKRFCVNEALLDVIYPMESVAYEKGIVLSVQVQDNMYLTGNEEQIKSLISILMDNAISYTPEKGRIKIEAHLHARKFCLNVSNTGEPISDAEREKLFERFYRQDEARTEEDNHFGLGLSIAKSIVSNHHGQIGVERRNEENCFMITMPVG